MKQRWISFKYDGTRSPGRQTATFLGSLLTVVAVGSTGYAQTGSAQTEPRMPPAECGECFARIMVAAKYETEEVEVLVREESEKVTVTEPEFEWVTERIEISPAYKVLKPVQTKWGRDNERVVVRPRHLTWKKGSGPLSAVNNATGEIMCRTEVPERALTLAKTVVREPPRVVEVEVPAKHKTVRVKRLKKPAQVVRTTIPAKYKKVTRTVKATDAKLEWAPVLCETNASRTKIKSIQRALINAGHNGGRVDGRLSSKWMSALRAYQKSKNMAEGYLTRATLDSLNISMCGPPKKQAKVEIKGDRLDLVEPVYFETAKAIIKQRSYPILDAVYDVLKRKPKMSVRIEGHTDSQGSDESNLDLSKRRAESVRKYLLDKGIEGQRMRANGFGEAKPIASNASPTGRAKNRRVDFVIQ